MPDIIKEFDPKSDEFRPLGSPIKEEAVGLRIDAYLSTNFPFYSRATWQKRMKEGRLLVDGKPVKPSNRLVLGQVIKIHHPQLHEPAVDNGIYPIWKQGQVMAVFKPGNLPMHENGPYRNNTFAALIRDKIGEQWAAVHRLDRETSGIVLCGASHEVRQGLSASLAKKNLGKEYTAIVHGTVKDDQWEHMGAIGDLENSKIRIKKWVVPGGQAAETAFETIARKGAFSRLRVFPKTGRTNQIRIHAAHVGHHLVGDITYHPNEAVFLEWFANGKSHWVKSQTGYDRCLLHAAAVTFVHPETQQLCYVRCPEPHDMTSFWDSIPPTAEI